MPDDESPLSRGIRPQPGRGTLRPTLIDPTTVRTRTPTAEAGRGQQAERAAGPTVIEKAGCTRRITRADGRPPDSPVTAQPTAVPGVERKRIAVDIADLRRLSPQARPRVLERALRLVETFVVAGARDRQAVMWGQRLQQDHSDQVSQTLELSQADVLKRVTRYIGRMTDILGSIDIEAICGVAPAMGILGRYFKGMNTRIDTARELDAARVELDQLVGLMGAAFEHLLSLKETLEQQSSQVEEIGDAVEAAALAAEFLSAHLRESQPGLSQRFLERSMSLTQTVAQIRGSTSIREVQIEQPLRLIGAIQNVALVSVPGWLGSMATLSTMLERNRKPTPTEASEFAYKLRDMLQQLKG